MNYEFVDDIKAHKHLKQELTEIIEKHAPKTTFDRWMLTGHEDDKYKYSGLIDSNNKLVTAIGLMPTTLYLESRKHSAIQIGNIFFENSSLSLEKKVILQNHLLQIIRTKYDHLIDFAYAYQTNLDDQFIKQLGLVKVDEVQYFLDVTNLERKKTVFKNLDLSEHNNRKELFSMVKHADHISKTSLDISKDSSVRYYNILKYYFHQVYFIESLETIVVLQLKKTKCKLIGVFCKSPISLLEVIQAIVPDGVTTLEFGFNPQNLIANLEVKINSDQIYQEIKFGTSKLYLQAEGLKLCGKKIMFPLLTRQQ